jgi:DNA-binding winged helix-turn-helix (wHTH) protein
MAEELSGYQFDDIILDVRNRQLKRQGKILSLNAKYFEVLIYLVEHYNQLVTKDELFQKIWNDVIVTDWALSQCIKDIRKVLGDNARNPKFIKTFPKHGFMFIVEPMLLSEIKTELQPGEEFHRRPFKFLDFYTEADADLFYGRESEINNLCSKILGHQSFVLYGRSGVGKSSIVHAGIVPSLKERGYRVFVIRDYHDSPDKIFKLLNLDPKENSNAENGILKDANFSSNNQTVVLIFDQFEEFFLRSRPKTKSDFLHNLQDLFKRPAVSLKLVFVIREDLLAELDSLKELIPDIFHHVHRLLKLTAEQAFQAIVEPGKRVNCEIEEKLVSQIINDLTDRESIDPPQLQIVCDALFDMRDQNSRISMDIYQKLGGASLILSNYLDRVMHRFHSEDSEIAKQILKALVSEDHQRLLLEQNQLLKTVNSKDRSAKQIESIISELERARVIRFHPKNNGIFLELTHDFLVNEIIKWYSEEEIIFNRTRAIFDSAYQNYQSHQLLMDEDFLDLVLPVGERLFLDNQQAEFLGKCLLSRKKSIPDWLIQRMNAPLNLFNEYIINEDETIRIAVIDSLRFLEHPELLQILLHGTLWDKSLSVRKSAGIMLLEKYGEESLGFINDKKHNKEAGIFRTAVSLALIRDHQKQLFKPQQLPIILALIVFAGLAWVRIRRARFYILQQTMGGSLGAALSGGCVGFSLGTILLFYRDLPAYESTTLVLVLTSLGMITGLLVGMGISLGMSSMRVISYRHHPAWSIAGAVLGGASIGGILHLLGVDTFLALFGQKLSNIAGAYEGALVGFGLSIGTTIGNKLRKNSSWLSVMLAACGSMLAAILLTLIQGNLFSASIESIARSFANSQIRFEALANLFGEAYFGQVSRLILGAFEGFLFGGFTVLGIEMFARRKWGDLFPEF